MTEPTDALTEEEIAEARAFYDVSDNAMKLAVFDYGCRLLATLDQRTRERERDALQSNYKSVVRQANDLHERCRINLERAEAAERERDEAITNGQDRIAELLAEVTTVEREREALREALERYGSHQVGCSKRKLPAACTCGLDAALAPRPPAQEE